MFSERNFEVPLDQDEPTKPQNTKGSMIDFWLNKGKVYLTLFLDTSSIHGLNHLVAARRQYFEIFLWLSIIVISGFGSFYLSRLTWTRYQSSPTVISMDRDMFAWNTTFPCVTICPDSIHNIDKEKLDIYLRNSNEENKTKLEAFIIGLANASYKSFEHVPEYPDISPDDYLNLLLNLSLAFKPALTIGVTNAFLTIVPTVTEMGLCYAVNSRVSVYNSPDTKNRSSCAIWLCLIPIPLLAHTLVHYNLYLLRSLYISVEIGRRNLLSARYRAANRWDIIKNNKQPLSIHPLDGEVFAQVMNMTTRYHVYLHGPDEIPDSTSKYQESESGYYMKMYVTALSVYTSKEAAKLSVSQRGCRFSHENNLKHNTIYTYSMCRMECRIRLCLKYCDCIPHFYRKRGDEKICDVEGLHCLSRFKDELYTLEDKNKKRINCGCFPLCDDVNYVLQSNALQEWFLGTNLQWGMVSYPRMRYRRDIIFGFTDVLVAVGGMAGLFLGCSVLSFIEIFYFITLRLMCYRYKSSKSYIEN